LEQIAELVAPWTIHANCDGCAQSASTITHHYGGSTREPNNRHQCRAFCAGIAALVGHLVGRRQQISIAVTLTDMLLTAALVGRIVFVAMWFEYYRDAPWTMRDIRDGGFTPWACVSAAVGVKLWQGWRHTALRGPLLFGLIAGSLAWGVSPALLRLNTGPATRRCPAS